VGCKKLVTAVVDAAGLNAIEVGLAQLKKRIADRGHIAEENLETFEERTAFTLLARIMESPETFEASVDGPTCQQAKLSRWFGALSSDEPDSELLAIDKKCDDDGNTKDPPSKTSPAVDGSGRRSTGRDIFPKLPDTTKHHVGSQRFESFNSCKSL
jgi:hypothetical protein